MIDTQTDDGRLIDAAMRLAAQGAWSDVTLRDIAEAAGLSLVTMRAHFPNKAAILAGFTRAADEVVLREAERRPPVGSPRDAIFEVVMSRFDAMEPYKAALRSIVRSSSRELPDPAMMRAVLSSQHWMLEASGVDTSGPGGAIKTLGLASVYASVFRDWLDDDDPGLARTMAALDRRLRRGEQNLAAFDSVAGIGRRLAGILTPRPRADRSDAAANGPTRTGDTGPQPGSTPQPSQQPAPQATTGKPSAAADDGPP